jgi:hypothetical protein
MLTSGVDMGDRDTEYFKQYRRALLDGQTVIKDHGHRRSLPRRSHRPP